MTETPPLLGLRKVIEALLPSETEVIYAAPEPSDSPRPELPYTSLFTLRDTGLARPRIKNESVVVLPSPDPDVRQDHRQQRQALIKCTFYGPSAMARALFVSVGLTSDTAKDVWRGYGVACERASEDVENTTRLIGNRNEESAQVDAWVRYPSTFSELLYSVQTTNVNYTIGS